MESKLLLEYKSIKVRKDLYDRLAKHIDKYGETMSDILERVLNVYERKDVLHEKPYGKISSEDIKEIFNKASEGKKEVDKRNVVYELVKSGKLTEDQAHSYIRKAIANGTMFENNGLLIIAV